MNQELNDAILNFFDLRLNDISCNTSILNKPNEMLVFFIDLLIFNRSEFENN